MILAFDSGTTNTKTFLFNDKSELLASASHPTKIIYKSSGMVEQKAEYWWDALVKSAEKLRNNINWQREDIEAIAVSSQGGTFVPLDERFKPLRPGITWLDNRGASISKNLNREYGKVYFFNKTGHYLSGWSPPSVFLWLKEKEPSVFSRTGRLSFVADYLNYKLTGRFFLDATSAQMSCFFNIVKGCWDKKMLSLAGIGKESLPVVIPSDCVGGRVTEKAARDLDVPSGIPVVAGGHDQYCASLGAGAVNRGDCLLSCGTAWALLVITDETVFIPNSGWFPGRHLREKNYGLMAAISNGGVVLDWIRDNIKTGDFADINKDSSIKVVTDFMQERGSITNISLSDTGNEIYYATMRSLALTVKERLEVLQDKIEVRRLLMVGGGTREKLLPPLVEKETGIKVVLPGVSEAAGRGAALLALGCGL